MWKNDGRRSAQSRRLGQDKPVRILEASAAICTQMVLNRYIIRSGHQRDYLLGEGDTEPAHYVERSALILIGQSGETLVQTMKDLCWQGLQHLCSG